MAEPFTIYKLTILNMLDKVDFPLTNTQISDFFLEQEYTDYFRVQQVLNDLADSGLIRTESTHSNTQYYITAAGRETLGFFRDKLTDAIEHDTIAHAIRLMTPSPILKKIKWRSAPSTRSSQTITRRRIRTMPCAVSSASTIPT